MSQDFYQGVKAILEQARQSAYRAVNFAMVMAYWEIGRLIVEEEQQRKDRAEYGKALIAELYKRLTHDFGKGFTARNLRNMRAFYLAFPIWHALSAESEVEEKVNALRTELRPLEKGQPVRDQLPTVEKLSALRSELTWMHYTEMVDAREILRFSGWGGGSEAFCTEFFSVGIDS